MTVEGIKEAAGAVACVARCAVETGWDSVTGIFKDAAGGAIVSTLSCTVTKIENDDVEALNKATGSDHFAHFLFSLAPKLIALIQSTTEENCGAWTHSAVKRDLAQIEECIPYLLVRIGRNLVDAYRSETEAEKVELNEILLYALNFLESDLEAIHNTYPKILEIEDTKERDAALTNLLQPISDKVVEKVLPKGVEEIPFWRLARTFVFREIRVAIIPLCIDAIYHILYDPKGEDQTQTLQQMRGGSFLTKLAEVIAKKSVENAPLLIEEQSEKIAHTFADEMDISWLAEQLKTLVQSQDKMARKTWNFLFHYLNTLIVNGFVGLARGAKKEGEPNVIKNSAIKLIKRVHKFLKNNHAKLAEVKTEQEIQDIFKPLINNLLQELDLHFEHLLKRYPVIKEEVLPGFLYEYYQDVMRPQIEMEGRFSEYCPKLAKELKELLQDYLVNQPKDAASLLCSALFDRFDDRVIEELTEAIQGVARTDSKELTDSWCLVEKAFASTLYKLFNNIVGNDEKNFLSDTLAQKIGALLSSEFAKILPGDNKPEAFNGLAEQLIALGGLKVEDIPVPSVQFQQIVLDSLRTSILPALLSKLYEKHGKALIAAQAIAGNPDNHFESSPLNDKPGGKELLHFMRSLTEQAADLLFSQLETKGKERQDLRGEKLVSLVKSENAQWETKRLLETLFIHVANKITDGSGSENALYSFAKELIEAFQTHFSETFEEIMSLDRKVYEGIAQIYHGDPEEILPRLFDVDLIDQLQGVERERLALVQADENKLIQAFVPLVDKLLDLGGVWDLFNAVDPNLRCSTLPMLFLDYYRDIHRPQERKEEAQKQLTGLIASDFAPLEEKDICTVGQAKEQLDLYHEKVQTRAEEAYGATTVLAEEVKKMAKVYLETKTESPRMKDALAALYASEDAGVQGGWRYAQEVIATGIFKGVVNIFHKTAACRSDSLQSGTHPNEKLAAEVVNHMMGLFQKHHSHLNPDIIHLEEERNRLQLLETKKRATEKESETLLSLRLTCEVLRKIQETGPVTLRSIFDYLKKDSIAPKDKVLLEELIRQQFLPLSQEFLQEVVENPLSELPLPKVLKPIALDYIQQELLPHLFADLYQQTTLWMDQTEELQMELKGTVSGNHLNELARVLSRFATNYLPFYLTNEKEDIKAFLNRDLLGKCLQQFSEARAKEAFIDANLDALAACKKKEAWGGIEQYIQSMLLKLLHGLTLNIEQHEHAYGATPFICNLLLGVLKDSNKHLETLDQIAVKARAAHKVDAKKMRQGFKDKGVLHAASATAHEVCNRVEKQLTAHKFLLPETHLPAYLQNDSELKKQVLQEGAKWKLKDPKKSAEFLELVKSRVLLREFYTPLSEKLLALAHLNDEKEQPPFFAALKEGVFPALLQSMYALLLDPHTLNSMSLSMLKMFNDIEAGAQEEQKKLNFGEFLMQLTDMEALLDTIGKNQLKDQTRIEKARKKLEGLNEEFSKIQNATESKVFSSIYQLDTSLQKLYNLRDIPPPEEESYKLTDSLNETRGKIQDTRTWISGFVKKKERKITEEEKKAFEECGELVLKLAKWIPHTFTFPLIESEKVRTYTKEAIGRAFREKIDNQQWSFLNLLDQAVKSGVPLIHEGEFEGEPHEARFVAPEGNLKFKFAQTDKEKAREKAVRDKNVQQTKRELEMQIVKTVHTQMLDAVRSFFSYYWEKIQGVLDFVMEKYFGEKGMRVKKYLDVQFRRVFINGLGAILTFFFTNLLYPVWWLLNLQIKHRARDFIKNIGMQVHEDLLFHMTDTLIRNLEEPAGTNFL